MFPVCEDGSYLWHMGSNRCFLNNKMELQNVWPSKRFKISEIECRQEKQFLIALLQVAYNFTLLLNIPLTNSPNILCLCSWSTHYSFIHSPNILWVPTLSQAFGLRAVNRTKSWPHETYNFMGGWEKEVQKKQTHSVTPSDRHYREKLRYRAKSDHGK